MMTVDPVSPLRVLIADDNRDAADSLAQLVRLWGHDAQVAYDGASALTTAVAYRPEVVLLDVAMPGLDGNRVAGQLRVRSDISDTLLVAVSGFADEAHLTGSLKAGFDRYLVKPVDPTCLEEILALRLEARRLQEALRRAFGLNQELRQRCEVLLRQALHGIGGLKEQIRSAWQAVEQPSSPPAGH
jgi:DNA-binding response OmpR family regulator